MVLLTKGGSRCLERRDFLQSGSYKLCSHDIGIVLEHLEAIDLIYLRDSQTNSLTSKHHNEPER